MVERTDSRMIEQDPILVANLAEAAARRIGGIGRVVDPIIPFKPVGECGSADVAGADEGRAPNLAPIVVVHADVSLEMKALIRCLEDPHVGAALHQQHEPAQGLRVGDIQIVAGQDPQTRAPDLDCIGQRIEQQAQSAGFDEGDREVDLIRSPDRSKQVRKKGILPTARG